MDCLRHYRRTGEKKNLVILGSSDSLNNSWTLLKHCAYLNTARDCALHVIPPLISLQPLQHLRFSTIEIDSYISSINFQKTTRRTASRTWRCSVPRSSSCLAFFDTASTSLTKKRWSPLCSEARPHLHVQRDLLLLILVHLPLLALITGIIFSPKEIWMIRDHLPVCHSTKEMIWFQGPLFYR